MEISAQLQLYPLAEEDYGTVIWKAIDRLRAYEDQGLRVEVGPMSTLIAGEADLVWRAVRELFTFAAEGRRIVLVTTMSNVCPKRA
ncbi:MAG: Ykof family thiamine-binding protein [Brockia lithotrophica]|nr:Ykof family thiamine-binding protein [Brockia lithotrophica]